MPYEQSETPHPHRNADSRESNDSSQSSDSSDSEEDEQVDSSDNNVDWARMLSMPREIFWDRRTAGGLTISHSVPFFASPVAFWSGMLLLLLVTFARQLPSLLQPLPTDAAGESDDDFAGNDPLVATMARLLALILQACANPARAAPGAIAPIAPRSPHATNLLYHLAQFGLGMGTLSALPTTWQAYVQWQHHHRQRMVTRWFGEELHRVETALDVTEQVWPPTMLAALSQAQIAALANTELPAVPVELVQAYCDILRTMADAATGPDQLRSRQALLALRTLLQQHTLVAVTSTLDGPSTSQENAPPWHRPAGEESASASSDGGRGRVARWYAAASAFGVSALPSFLYQPVAIEEIPMYQIPPIPEAEQAHAPVPNALVNLFQVLSPILLRPYRSAMQSSTTARIAIAGGLAGTAVLGTGMYYLSAGATIELVVDAFLHETYDNETGMSFEDALITELYFSLDDPTHATQEELIEELKHFLLPAPIESAPAEAATSISPTDRSSLTLQPEPVASTSFNASATLAPRRVRRAASSIDEETEILEKPKEKAEEEAIAERLWSAPLRARMTEIHGTISSEEAIQWWKTLAIRIQERGGTATTDPHPAFEALRKNRSDSRPQWSNITGAVFNELLEAKRPPSAMNADSDLAVGDLWLHEFADLVTPGTGHAGPPVRSTPLTAVLQQGLPPGRDWNNTYLDGKIGVHSSPSPTISNAVPITIATLVETLRAVPAEAQRRYDMALKERWVTDATTSVDTEAILLSKSVLDFTRIQLAMGVIQPRAMRMLFNAAGAMVSEEGRFQAMPLEIGGYYAVDAVVLAHDDGAVVLVMPRFPFPVQAFQDLHAMRKAIVKFASANRTRSRIEESFRLSDRIEEGVLNLDGFLDLLVAPDTDIDSVIQNKARERTITGNIFHWMATQRQTEEFAEYSQFKDNVQHDNPHRYLENQQRTAYTVPPVQLTTPIRNAWHTQLSVAADQLGAGQASGIPASTYSEPQPSAGIAGLGATEAAPLMQRRIMLGATRQLLHNVAPDIAYEATAAIRNILESDFRRVEDPNDLCFSTYQPEFLPQFVDTHVKPRRNPEAFHLTSTISLVELGFHSPLMSTVIKAHTKPTSRGAPYLITRCNAIPPELLSPYQSFIPVKDFINKLRDKKKFDLKNQYQKKLTDFFKKYSPYLEKHAIQRAMLSADLMRKDGSLSQEDHDIVMKAFAQDANSPSGDVTVRLLSLYRYRSIDCLHIESQNPHRVLLYMPGEALEIRGFAARPSAVTWLQSLHQDRENLARFVKAHFSLEDNEKTLYYQGRFFSPGVEEFLKQAAIPPSSVNRGQSGASQTGQRFQLGRAQKNYLNGRAVNAPFSALNRIAEKAASDDAKLLIDSADDRLDQWWADAVGFVPIPFLDGVVKMSLAKTTEAYKQAIESFGLDGLMAAFPFGMVFRLIPFKPLTALSRSTVRLVGEKSIAVEGGAIPKFDSFFRPPVRINGKLGYLLSPNPTARYTVKMELEKDRLAFEEGEYATLSDQVKSSWKNNYEALIADAETSFGKRAKVLANSGRPDATLPPGKTTLADCVPTLFADETRTGGALNKGLIVGEEHMSSAAREAIFDSLDAFQTAGVKTIYTEWFLHEEHKAMLDAYYESGEEMTQELAELLREIDDAAGVSDTSSYSMKNILRETREKGIRFVGVDTRTVSGGLPDDLLYPGHLWRDDRLTGMNYYAEQVIRKHQLANGNAPWILLVGYRHGVRFPKGRTFTGEYIPGMSQLLDAMAIYVTEDAEHEPVGYEGRILHY